MNIELFMAVLGTAVVTAIAVVSARHYDHRGEAYREDREPNTSIGHFRYVYRLLQLSTIGIGIAAFWSDQPWLLKLHHYPFIQLVGLLLAMLAASLFVASKRSLGDNYSPCFDAYSPPTVVRSGPYRRIRHPIYTANVALLLAFFLATGSLWLLLNSVILAGYYYCSALSEEHDLRAAHPGYADYRRHTGMFLPRLRRPS